MVPALSVIVPVYNVSSFLPECLNSLTSQTFRDIEIICVDDGSTDDSLSILREVAGVDPRVTIIEKPNGGLSSARNAGLAAATGKVVMFIDSDDFLDDDACSIIAGVFAAEQCDIVVFGAEFEPRDAQAPSWMVAALRPKSAIFNGFTPSLLFDENTTPFVWRCAFSKEFLGRESLTFDESIRFGEDQVFLFHAYPASERTVLLDARPYHYRVVRPESLMDTRANNATEKLLNHQEIVARIVGIWEAKGWLETYQTPLLQWVIEFLIPDIVHAESDAGKRLLFSASEILRRYFPLAAELMQTYSALGMLLAAIAKSAREGNDPRRLSFRLAAYLWSRRGLRWVFQSALRHLRSSPVRD